MGSIAPGKVANFTVLEEDPLAVDPMKLKDIPHLGDGLRGAGLSDREVSGRSGPSELA